MAVKFVEDEFVCRTKRRSDRDTDQVAYGIIRLPFVYKSLYACAA